MMIMKTDGMPPLKRTGMRAEPSETPVVRAKQFDRVELTAKSCSEDERFAKELASRISYEVRTTKPEELSALQQQVQSGGYRIHADELAAQILLFGGRYE